MGRRGGLSLQVEGTPRRRQPELCREALSSGLMVRWPGMGGAAWSWGPFPGCAHPLPSPPTTVNIITLAGCSMAGADPRRGTLSSCLEKKMSLEVSLGGRTP